MAKSKDRNNDAVFRSLSGVPIKLTISHYGEDGVEMTLHNLEYRRAQLREMCYLISVLCFYTLYCCRFKVSFPIHGICIVASMILLWRLLHIIKSEYISIIRTFAIESHTNYCFGKLNSRFIPLSLVTDVVINEVIYNVKYILIALTKGRSFGCEPIIPLMNVLNANRFCLQKMYREICRILWRTDH